MLTNSQNTVYYQISGSTYPIPFPYWKESEIKAYITLTDGTITELTLDTDYTVTTPDTSGTLTKVTAWTDAEKLTIMRKVALDQELDLINGEKIDAENLEDALDHVVAGLIQVQEQIDRSVTTSLDEQGTGLTFPSKAARAGSGEGTIMGFDSTGEEIELRDLAQFDSDVAAAIQAASDAGAAQTAAETAEAKAKKWADESEDVEVETGAYSAKHWAAKASASAASAESSAEDSEAYAVGKRGGVDVGSDDVTYHNNSKYYLEQVRQTVTGSLRYQGTWTITGAIDYSALSTPRLLGDMFYCQGTACTIDGVTYTQGDYIIFNQDVASGTTITTAMIDKIDNTETVTPDNTVPLSNKTVACADNNITTTASKVIVSDADGNIGAGSIDAGKIVSTDDTQTLTNKTINGQDNTIKVTNHNIMREVPKDITAYYTDGTLWDRIAGTNGFDVMEDIYAGDYFQMAKRAITAYNPAGGTYAPGGTDWIQGTQWVTVAGIDTLMGNGDGGDSIANVDYHHLVMVPGKGDDDTEVQHFGRSWMNSSNTTANGYTGSAMHSTVLGAVVTSDPSSAGNTDSINKQLRYEFGSHLKTTRELLTNAINASGYNRYGSASGASSGWAWASCQAVLMSEVECYGSIVWSSSGFDTGNANHWMPAFQQSNRIRNNRTAYYWLKDVVSSASFAYAHDNGYSSRASASYANFFVRPRFVIA